MSGYLSFSVNRALDNQGCMRCCGYLEQDIGHGAHHVQCSVQLARVRVRVGEDGHHELHRLLQHLLALLGDGVEQRLGGRHGGDEVLEHVYSNTTHNQ